MSNNVPPSVPEPHDATPTTVKNANVDQGPVDGLSLWEAESAGDSPVGIELIRLDKNERMVIPFTTSIERRHCHYLDFPEQRGYVQCLGEDCLLCRIGRTHEARDLWPVYDVLDQAVGVLPISPNVRPGALRPQLMPIFKRVAADEPPFLISIRKDGFARFAVSTSSLPDGADTGAASIAEFNRRLGAGEIDLGSVFPQLANDVLSEIPHVRLAMDAKGLGA